MMDMSPNRLPDAPSMAGLRHLIDAQLSLGFRLAHVALLLGALTMTVIVASLWMTEPTLPVRTQLGFAFIITIGLSWVTFAAWVLTRRRPLYGRQSIIAGRMAVLFTSLFVLGALSAGVSRGGAAPFVAAGAGIVMLAAAISLLVRANRVFARLLERRATLEREQTRSMK